MAGRAMPGALGIAIQITVTQVGKRHAVGKCQRQDTVAGAGHPVGKCRPGQRDREDQHQDRLVQTVNNRDDHHFWLAHARDAVRR